jgi:RNA-directed DNA polymerase
MHDPVTQTGGWLKSVVQGYFNYYAVPGNLDRLAIFRRRLLALWWHKLRRRSQQRHLSWTRMIALGERWLPPPGPNYFLSARASRTETVRTGEVVAFFAV